MTIAIRMRTMFIEHNNNCLHNDAYVYTIMAVIIVAQEVLFTYSLFTLSAPSLHLSTSSLPQIVSLTVCLVVYAQNVQ